MPETMHITPPIGFIGLGDMGRPLALRLLRAGLPLVVCDANPDTLAPFIQGGARVAMTPRETASIAEFVFTCLPAPPISEAVAFGDDGLIHGSRIRCHLELSTIGPATMRTITTRLGERNIQALDAPVSGGPRGEARGRLSCFVSGPRNCFDEAEPVLKVLSDKLFHIGDLPGQSQVLKLANNLLGAANLTIASEMLLMTCAAGIDPKVAIDVINVSTGRNRATEEIIESQIISRQFNLGARLNILQKDVALAVAEAKNLGTPHTAASGVNTVWQAAVAQGHGTEDLSRIYAFLESQGIEGSTRDED